MTKPDAIISYILSLVPAGLLDIHGIFKVLYFAERRHLAEYGRMISDDEFDAMEFGPVPTKIYDNYASLKSGKGNNRYFKFLYPYYLSLSATEELDFEILSDSEKECLNHGYELIKEKNFNEITEMAHDKAWRKSRKKGRMDISEIARAGNATDEMIKYIKWNLENKRELA